MTLSKESADAFRQCLRILAPRCTPEERRVQSRNVESYIAEGKWIPALLVEDIALLFYPNDLSLESAMLIKMKEAIETQKLISTPMKKDVLMASDLASWPDCPPVPNNSPLRFWLPDWMRATPASNITTADLERRLARLRELGGNATHKYGKWKIIGISALVASEKNEGRKRSDEKTIRTDLKVAAQNELEEKRANAFTGLGQK